MPNVASDAARTCVQMAILAQTQPERWNFNVRFDLGTEGVVSLRLTGWLYLGSHGSDAFRCWLTLKPGI